MLVVEGKKNAHRKQLKNIHRRKFGKLAMKKIMNIFKNSTKCGCNVF